MNKYAALAVVVVSFCLGFALAHWRGQAEMESMIADHATRVANAENEYAKKLEAERHRRELDVSSLLSQIRESHERERSLTRIADRLRNELTNRASRPSASAGACGAIENRLAGCTRLLSEGVELVAEGAALSERIAVRKDGISDYAK